MTDLAGQERHSPFRNAVERYGIVAVVAVFYATVAFHFDYTPDDTYIYLQYAKHVASGDGFSFNRGTPSYGVTGPLWALLVAAGTAGGLDPYIAAKTLDIVLASLAILVLYVLASIVLKERLYALGAACVFSLDAWFLRWSSSGMETSAAVLLSLLAVFYVFKNEYLISSMICGLLTLLRPEGVMLFAVVQADNFLNTTDVVPARKVFLRSAGLYGLITLPWAVYALLTFGSLVPNTAAAKTFEEASISGTVFVLLSELKILGSTQGVWGAALGAGLVIGLKKSGWKKLRLEIFPLFWIAAVSLFYGVLNVQVVSRYLLLIIPFVIMYGVWGLKQVTEQWKPGSPRSRIALVLIFFAAVIQSQGVYRFSVIPHMKGFVSGMNECLKPMAYWLKENSQTSAKVLTPDVGLLGYISERELYDTAGLIAPEIKRAFHGVGYGEGMRKKRYEEVLKPDYVVDRSESKERLASEELVPVMTKEFLSLGVLRDRPVFYTLYRVRR